LQGKPSATAGTVKNSGGALLHAPPPLAARGFTRRRRKLQENQGSGMSSSPLPFLAGGEDHRYL